jgi:hypothetical protein
LPDVDLRADLAERERDENAQHQFHDARPRRQIRGAVPDDRRAPRIESC